MRDMRDEVRAEPMTDRPYATFQGDALAVLAGLDTGIVDGIITDPPYSSGGMVRGDRMATTKTKYALSASSSKRLDDFTGDNRDQRAYAYWSALWLEEARRVTRPGGPVILFTDWRQLPATSDALQAGGWVWRGIVPWVKPSARPYLGRFTNQCEYVLWGSNGPMPVEDGAECLPGFLQAMPPRERVHITQKPLEVMRSLVRIVPPGELVCDPFMGSGTTGVAALAEDRRFLGVERSPSIYRTAVDRLETAAGTNTGQGEQSALAFGDDPDTAPDALHLETP